MKRLVSSLLCSAILLACLVLSLSSCAGLEIAVINRLEGKDRAAAVFLRMSVALAGVKSYTVDSAIDCDMQISKNKNMSIHVDQTDTIEQNGSEIKSRRCNAKESVTLDGQEPVTEEQTMIFSDGKLGIANESNGVKIFSAASADTAKEFFGEAETSDLDFNEISTVTCDYEKGIGWTIALSGMSGKTLDILTKEFDSIDEVFDGFHISDAVLRMTVSENMLPSSMKFDYVFESNSPDKAETKAPTLKAESTYRDFGSTTVDADLTGFTEVPDIAVLNTVYNAVKDAKNAASGSFSYSTTNTIVNDSRSAYSEDGTVTYSSKDDKFTYRVTAKTNDNLKVNVYYADGSQVSKVRALPGSRYYGYTFKDQTARQTDTEAKYFIKQMIDTGNFNKFNISSFELLGEHEGKKTYKFKIGKPNTAQLANAIKQSGINEEKATFDATITVVMEGDKLLEYTYVITCKENSFAVSTRSALSKISYSNEVTDTEPVG